MNARLAKLAAVACAALGCVRPGEDRALRDREIGKAESDALRVRVRGGLAAVRGLDAERLVLWGSAPSFEFELEARAAGNVRLELQNCLPNAELIALEPERASVQTLDEELPTRKSWRLELPFGRSSFRLAAPDAAERGAFRFALMSDVQEAIDGVQDIFQRINAEREVRFLLGAGDLTERGSREEHARFQSELRELDVPYFTTLGNHELGANPPPFQDWHGRASFQFEHRAVFFTLLDSASATLDPIVYDWLDGWLANARNDVHVVAMHIPPLDPIGVRNGAFASRAEAAALLARLAQNGVDLTLYGHIHSYYRFENAGIPALISGGGGAIPERFDNVGRHFLLIDVDPERGVLATRLVEVD